VSGGQTGVDRAALDAAIKLNIEHGGWCPEGRLAEDGRISMHYQLTECDSPKYDVRTEKNVIDSDGTLILFRGSLTGGTKLTARFAKRHKKPLLILNFDEKPEIAAVRSWLSEHQVEVLNVAGPRESTQPGIYNEATQYLILLLQNDLSANSLPTANVDS
jgi:hypothetical protein